MNRLTRRDVLRLAGVGAAGLAFSCGDNSAADPDHRHASAILEPDSESFLVALWSAGARRFAVEVRTGEALVHDSVAEIGASGSVAIDVRGLAPATAYQVMLLGDTGVRLGPHHVRTAPRDDDPRPVRLAVSADLDPFPLFHSDLLEHLAAASPELFVSLGDFPYTDNGPPADTLETYRERHVELRTDPRVRAWLQTVGVRAIYDDHEFRNDWDARFVAIEAGRYAAAMQVWDEFFPVRTAGDVRYRAWRWGRNVECFLLDCRRFRSPNAMHDDAAKTMLGAAQRAWLIEGVTRSTATFKLVFTSVPLDFAGGNDAWHVFRTERDLVLSALAGVPGVLFVSADQHWFAAHRHARGVREFQVGPLARGLGRPGPARPEILYQRAAYNFGLIEIDDTNLTFSAIDGDGEAFYRETLTVAELTSQR
jgi:alkaline phosphatase D